MKDKLIRFLDGMGVTSHTLHLIVGAYIAYLGLQIVHDQIHGLVREVIPCIGAAVLILTGVPIAVVSLWGLLRKTPPADDKKE